MQFINALKPSKAGFTLLEMLVVLIVVGILSAILAPSLLGLYARNQMAQALGQVQGAFQEAQRQAMRTSRTCSLTIDTTTNRMTGSCLVSGDRLLTGVSLRSSLTTLQFNIKGIMVDGNGSLLTQPITVVLSSSTIKQQSCLVVAAPLGLMRRGNYTGSDTVETSCTP